MFDLLFTAITGVMCSVQVSASHGGKRVVPLADFLSSDLRHSVRGSVSSYKKDYKEKVILYLRKIDL